MKLVDKNGKLFGKFNLVDAIVVLLVVVVVVAIGWKAVSASFTAAQEREAEELAENYENAPHLVYDVVCYSATKEVAQACAGQMELPLEDRQLMSNGKAIEGYVVDCSYEPHEDDGLYTLYFTLEALLEEKDGIYSVGSQEVRIGKGHIVKTYQIETSGSVYAMEVTGEVPADD